MLMYTYLSMYLTYLLRETFIEIHGFKYFLENIYIQILQKRI